MNASRVALRAAARRDLVEHYRWLREEAGTDVAERFLLGADTTFRKLAGQPGLGAPVEVAHPRLVGLRKGRIAGFPNILIFYLPREGGVSVVRVLHAARDWWALIGLAD